MYCNVLSEGLGTPFICDSDSSWSLGKVFVLLKYTLFVTVNATQNDHSTFIVANVIEVL